MSSYLFHVEVFVPARLKKPCFEGPLRYSRHAREASETDRFGDIKLPLSFKASEAELIEVELADDCESIIKQVWRQKLDEKRDLVLVLNPEGFVRTVWINLKTDKHRTLDRGRYVKA
jgi:hypothetical protein